MKLGKPEFQSRKPSHKKLVRPHNSFVGSFADFADYIFELEWSKSALYVRCNLEEVW